MIPEHFYIDSRKDTKIVSPQLLFQNKKLHVVKNLLGTVKNERQSLRLFTANLTFSPKC